MEMDKLVAELRNRKSRIFIAIFFFLLFLVPFVLFAILACQLMQQIEEHGSVWYRVVLFGGASRAYALVFGLASGVSLMWLTSLLQRRTLSDVVIVLWDRVQKLEDQVLRTEPGEQRDLI